MAKKPLYQEIRDKLTQSLMDGEWRPGQLLPSEPQLAKRYGVGISTVRAAVRELEQAKVLMRAQGKGTFVLHFDDRGSTHRFLNITRADGAAVPTDRKMVSLERVAAPADIAAALRLPRRGPNDDTFKMTTVVRLGGMPVYYSNVFVPTTIFPRLRKSLLPDGAKALYSLYQQNFNVNVIKVVDSLSTVPVPPEAARLCGLPSGTCVLRLRRIAFTYNDLPVEVRTNWISTARHCYRIVQGDRS
jgi:GntR family transcriptional regulator